MASSTRTTSRTSRTRTTSRVKRGTGATFGFSARPRTRDVHKFDGAKIIKNVKTNPRRPDTDGFEDWKLLKNGMTYEAFIRAGGSRRRLEENIARGFVTIEFPTK